MILISVHKLNIKVRNIVILALISHETALSF